MARQRESKLSGRIQTKLREQGVFCFKIHGSEMMMSGLPDIIACVDGRFVGFETKNPGQEGDTSARQEYVHTRIRKSGGSAYVISSVRQALDIVTHERGECNARCTYC